MRTSQLSRWAVLAALLLSGCASSPSVSDDAGIVTPDDAAVAEPDAGAALPDGGAGRTAEDCLNRTTSAPECKDCCDCLEAACGAVVACRDACPLHDFSTNGDFITVTVPSVLGAGGDYSVCTAAATEQDCKACCDCEDRWACGDQRFCRDACNASYTGYPALTMAAIGAPQLVAANFQFAEGPVWRPSDAALLFSDVDADIVYLLVPGSAATVLRSPSHKANGLALDTAGLLLAAEHGSRSVTRTLADGTVTTMAASFEGKQLNSPNDLVVRSDGTVYFTDPTYGLGSTPSALGYTGLFRIAPDGTLHLEAKIDGAPNGVDLSPDEHTLYLAATAAKKLYAFSVAADGATSGRRTVLDIDSPDGMAVDAAGNLYVAALDAGKGAVVVVSREGKRLGAITLDHQPTNCGFGGADGKSLYVTAREALYVIAAPIPGREWEERK